MIAYRNISRKGFLFRCLIISVITTFTWCSMGPVPALAQGVLSLPQPGVVLETSIAMQPPVLQGLKVDLQNPLLIDFLIKKGDQPLSPDIKEEQYSQLVHYFLAALTTPQEQMWVNLSPYEDDRIIPDDFAQTQMGQDLLAQDYILKQITAALMYPENQVGKAFWSRIYQRLYEEYGMTDVPVDTFHKVWIVPGEATVFEYETQAVITESHMEVKLEEDYLAASRQSSAISHSADIERDQDTKRLSTEIMREVIIPAIEDEVNQGSHFAPLRQIHQSLILAAWFKQRLRDSIFGHVYVDQNKNVGIEGSDLQAKEKIYDQYVQAFREGAYNEIREEHDPLTNQVVPRHYFSGGVTYLNVPLRIQTALSGAVVARWDRDDFDQAVFQHHAVRLPEQAMTASEDFNNPFANLIWKGNASEWAKAMVPWIQQRYRVKADEIWSQVSTEVIGERKKTGGIYQELTEELLPIIQETIQSQNKEEDEVFYDSDLTFWKRIYTYILHEMRPNSVSAIVADNVVLHTLARVDPLMVQWIEDNFSSEYKDQEKAVLVRTTDTLVFSMQRASKPQFPTLTDDNVNRSNVVYVGSPKKRWSLLSRIKKLFMTSLFAFLIEFGPALAEQNMDDDFEQGVAQERAWPLKDNSITSSSAVVGQVSESVAQQEQSDVIMLRSFSKVSLWQRFWTSITGSKYKADTAGFDAAKNAFAFVHITGRAVNNNEPVTLIGSRPMGIQFYQVTGKDDNTKREAVQFHFYGQSEVFAIFTEGAVIRTLDEMTHAHKLYAAPQRDTRMEVENQVVSGSDVIFGSNIALILSVLGALYDGVGKPSTQQDQDVQVNGEMPTGGIDFDHALLSMNHEGERIHLMTPPGFEWLLDPSIQGFKPALMEIIPSSGNFRTLPFFKGLMSKGLIPEANATV